MAQEKGWKPLPTSLKVLFIILVISLLSSLYSIGTISQYGYSILGFYISGIGAVISVIILNIMGLTPLLVGLWNRHNWVWKYGIVYFSFFILNGLLGLMNISRMIEIASSQLEATIPGATQIMQVTGVASILFGTALDVVFLIIIYKNKSYFE